MRALPYPVFAVCFNWLPAGVSLTVKGKNVLPINARTSSVMKLEKQKKPDVMTLVIAVLFILAAPLRGKGSWKIQCI